MFMRILFLFIAATCLAFSQDKKPTAIQIVDQIKKNTGVPWRNPTVDKFKAGDSSTTVTGIAVTMMATLDVLQQAVANGDNLIITHESLFFYHVDPTVPFENLHDSVYEAKLDFIKKHNLVVWRFHDNIHDMKPDGIMTGMSKALGWEKYKVANEKNFFILPPIKLENLATELKTKLGVKAMRVIGDPDAVVSMIGLCPGFAGFEINRSVFQKNGVDLLIIGEAHEWELGEYAADAITANIKKGLIVLGHIPSEQSGMEECTRWLKTFIRNVPIEYIPAKEPFRTIE